MSLYNHVIITHGRAEADQLTAAFSRLQLPLPMEDEFIETSDNGYMVFLEPYGTVARLIKDEFHPILRSDHVLQPIGSVRLNAFRLDINPGVITSLNEEDVDEIVDRLRRENIDYFDADAINTGWLPYATRDFPDGYPVVIDAGAVKKLTLASCSAGKAIKYRGIQEKLYGDLREAFSCAVRSGLKEDMKSFWEACAAKTEQCLLNASWTWREARNIRTISENYAGRLGAARPVL